MNPGQPLELTPTSVTTKYLLRKVDSGPGLDSCGVANPGIGLFYEQSGINDLFVTGSVDGGTDHAPIFYINWGASYDLESSYTLDVDITITTANGITITAHEHGELFGEFGDWEVPLGDLYRLLDADGTFTTRVEVYHLDEYQDEWSETEEDEPLIQGEPDSPTSAELRAAKAESQLIREQNKLRRENVSN